MFDKRLTDNINTHNNLKTVIVTGTKIKGEISGADEFYLEGELEGELKLDSLLILKEGGKLKGKVEADNIIIEGKMDGEIHAKNKIEVRASGRFSGTIDCNKIAIEEGAFFQGEVKMGDGTKGRPTYFKEKRKSLKK